MLYARIVSSITYIRYAHNQKNVKNQIIFIKAHFGVGKLKDLNRLVKHTLLHWLLYQ